MRMSRLRVGVIEHRRRHQRLVRARWPRRRRGCARPRSATSPSATTPNRLSTVIDVAEPDRPVEQDREAGDVVASRASAARGRCRRRARRRTPSAASGRSRSPAARSARRRRAAPRARTSRGPRARWCRGGRLRSRCSIEAGQPQRQRRSSATTDDDALDDRRAARPACLPIGNRQRVELGSRSPAARRAKWRSTSPQIANEIARSETWQPGRVREQLAHRVDEHAG